MVKKVIKTDYEKLHEQSEMMQQKALDMILDPKTKALDAIGTIYQMLEVAERLQELYKENEHEGQNEIKDELQAGEAKLALYEKTKDARWLKAAGVEADHAALYMELYKDYGMERWHTSIKNKIKELSA